MGVGHSQPGAAASSMKSNGQTIEPFALSTGLYLLKHAPWKVLHRPKMLSSQSSEPTTMALVNVLETGQRFKNRLLKKLD